MDEEKIPSFCNLALVKAVKNKFFTYLLAYSCVQNSIENFNLRSC